MQSLDFPFGIIKRLLFYFVLQIWLTFTTQIKQYINRHKDSNKYIDGKSKKIE